MKNTTTGTDNDIQMDIPELKWVNRISKLLDSKYRIPGTNIRFGWDPILSILPVAGDLATYIVSGVLIATMYKHGASKSLVVKMVANSTVDFAIGSIPVVGTIFDLFYKSNERNVQLLRKYYQQKGVLTPAAEEALVTSEEEAGNVTVTTDDSWAKQTTRRGLTGAARKPAENGRQTGSPARNSTRPHVETR